MIKLFRWETGRQNGGYSKLILISSKRFGFDLHLIRLPHASYVPTHTDPGPQGFEHHRINLTLWRPKYGGETFIALKGRGQAQMKITYRWYHFRPDVQPHSVTDCYGGSLILLSFGWLRKS